MNYEKLPESTPGNEEGGLIVVELSEMWKIPDHESHSYQKTFNLRVPHGDRHNLG